MFYIQQTRKRVHVEFYIMYMYMYIMYMYMYIMYMYVLASTTAV